MANSPATRGSILSLQDDRAFLKDSSTGQKDGDPSYALALENSKFILCPKGLGPSSWRIYEAMKAGRVPVIISDKWIPPVGIDWNSFSLRVPETETNNIPAILRSIEQQAPEMGSIARSQFHSRIGLHSSFNWLCERLSEIKTELSHSTIPIYHSRIIKSLTSHKHRANFTKEKTKELYQSAINIFT